MKLLLVLQCCLLVVQAAHAETVSPLQATDLRCEMATDPLGLDTPRPRLSWKLKDTLAGGRGQIQAAYHILVATTAAKLQQEQGDLWDSGVVKSDVSIMIPYAVGKLKEDQECFWAVQVLDRAGKSTAWSSTARWTMGLFSNASWVGQWIGADSSREIPSDCEIETSFTIERGAAGIYFHAHGPENAYMWQISVQGRQPEFKAHIREGGKYRVLKAVPLADVLARKELNRPHSMKIRMRGKKIDTFLDGKQIDSREDATFADGSVGFRESSDETAVFHSIHVVDSDGKTLVDDRFQNDHGYAGGKIVSEGMRVTAADIILADPAASAVRCPMLRKQFSAAKPLAHAWLYASALGLYELRLNGKQVGDQYYAPGWTNYRKTIEYQTYDVTKLIQRGSNAIGAQLAPGWYSGRIGWFGPNRYGPKPLLKLELHVAYADGTSEVLAVTDGSWKVAAGPVVSADNYDGENYDAQLEHAGWDLPSFDDSSWHSASLSDPFPAARLVSQVDPPMHVLQEFEASAVTEPQPGKYIYRFPQDINGVARIKIRGKAGATAIIQYAEGLRADGTIDTRNMSPPGLPQFTALATDRYTFGKTGEAMFEPRFTWRGYQYVQITGVEGKPQLKDVIGLSIGTDVPVIGHLETSDELVNRIFLNMFWSGRDAFMSYPMDCPQRCERLGWTGDANFHLATAARNFEMDRFYSKWENDLLDSQEDDGLMNNVSPNGWGPGSDGGYGGGWGDAGVCVPAMLWREYGDTLLLERSYAGMARWIEFLKSRSPGLITPAEWAAAGDWQQQGDDTPHDLCATAYFAYDVKLMSEMAAAIAKPQDAQKYQELFGKITDAFSSKWIDQKGKVSTGSQTAQILALHIGLVPDGLQQRAMDVLTKNVKAHGRKLTTGFAGTQWLLTELTRAGRSDLAYAILEQVEKPSWGYMVKLGSTTVWESWGAMLPNGTINGGPNSLNHCALGSAGDWMYRNIGAISHPADDVGYKRIVIQPSLGGGLTEARASHDSPYGIISTEWHLKGTEFVLNVTIPVNTTAKIVLPASSDSTVTESDRPAATAEGVRFLSSSGGAVTYEVGSGVYSFRSVIE